MANTIVNYMRMSGHPETVENRWQDFVLWVKREVAKSNHREREKPQDLEFYEYVEGGKRVLQFFTRWSPLDVTGFEYIRGLRLEYEWTDCDGWCPDWPYTLHVMDFVEGDYRPTEKTEVEAERLLDLQAEFEAANPQVDSIEFDHEGVEDVSFKPELLPGNPTFHAGKAPCCVCKTTIIPWLGQGTEAHPSDQPQPVCMSCEPKKILAVQAPFEEQHDIEESSESVPEVPKAEDIEF